MNIFRGSHVDRRLSRIRRYFDDEILSTFGSDRLVRFIGDAGRAFLREPPPWHCIAVNLFVPVAELVFQVVYSLLPDGLRPFAPLSAERNGTDVNGPGPLHQSPVRETVRISRTRASASRVLLSGSIC